MKKPFDEKEERVNQKLLDENRRYYPADKKGRIDEWGAMIKLQSELHEKDIKLNGELKVMQANNYHAELSSVTQEHQQERQRHIENKQRELLIMQDRKRDLDQVITNKKQEDREFKQFIADNYKQMMDEQKKKEYTIRNKELDDDNRKIEKAQQDLERERQYRQDQKLRLANDRSEDLTLKNYAKKIEEDSEKVNREEHKQLMEMNAQAQIKREYQYKSYFKTFEEKLNQKMDIHQQKVTSPETDKRKKITDWENNNERKYQEQLEMKEKREQEWRKQNHIVMHQTLQMQMKEKESQKVKDKEEHSRKVDESRQKAMENLEYERQVKVEKKQQQKLYGNTLQTQVDWQNSLENQYGTMTYNEKKLNKKDLATFKNFGDNGNSLIPGVKNSVFAQDVVPTRASGSFINNLYSGGVNQAATSPGSPYANSNGERLSPSKVQAPVGNSNYRSFSASIDFSKPAGVSKLDSSFNSGNQKQSYNPVTNPVPGYNQNPYITKQRAFLQSNMPGNNRSVVLSTAANNIIG